MHQNRFWLGLRPDPAGEFIALPIPPIVAIKWTYLQGKGRGSGRVMDMEGKAR